MRWRISSSQGFQTLAAVAGIGLLIVLAVMGAALLSRLDALKAAPRDNLQWGMMQILAEYDSLQLTLLEEQLNAGNDLAKVRTRLDILQSRANLIRTAPVYEDLRNDTSFHASLGRLYLVMEDFERIIDQPDTSGGEIIRTLYERSTEGKKSIRQLVLAAIVKFGSAADAEREDLSRFIQRLGSVGIALVALLLSAAFFYYLQGRTLARRERDLLESRERMSAASRVALDAIVMSDQHGKIIGFNDAATICFGYSKEQAIGADMASLIIPEHHRELHRRGMERYLSTGVTHVIGKRIEIEALHCDGREFPVELSLGVAKTGDVPIFIAYIRDISDRRRSEVELRKALDDAQAGERAKSRFLAVMSHEIRTPLNGIIGAMELLQQTPLDDSQAQYLGIAVKSGENLFAVINDILDVSRMNAAGIELKNQRVALREFLSSSVEVVAAGASDNGNQISIHIEPNVPRHVIIDGDRLRQVLLNFLSNAEKFTRGGDILLSVARIGGSDQRPLVEFSVSDTGIGFDPTMARDLFKDFSTLDSSYQRKTGGTGLGLAISKRIITAMGGEIGAEGKLGAGSRFWFRIALPTDEQRVDETVEEEHVPQKRSLNVLLVDDNLTNLLVTRKMLNLAGHHVVEARNGAEAVAKGTETIFDVILMDISMPEMDGLEATRRLRASGTPGGRVPIVALTASAMAEDVDRAMEAGMDGFVSKPIRREKLLAEIARHTGERVGDPASAGLDHDVLGELISELGEDIVRTVVKTFSNDLRERKHRLSQSLADKDIRAVQETSHAIVGGASTIGALRLAALARELEVCCKSHNVDEVIARGAAVMTAIDQTETSMDDWLNA
jgi:PAS domain S-box-containing protein